MQLWENSRNEVDEVEVTGYPFRHRRLHAPMEKPKNYDQFWKDYAKKGFEYCSEKYSNHKMEEPRKEAEVLKETKPETEETKTEAVKEEKEDTAQEAKQAETLPKKVFRHIKQLFGE